MNDYTPAPACCVDDAAKRVDKILENSKALAVKHFAADLEDMEDWEMDLILGIAGLLVEAGATAPCNRLCR